MAVLVCGNCAAGLANADESVWEDYSADEKAAIDASIESLGWGIVEEHDGGGYFDCFVCNEVAIGGHVFLPEGAGA